MMGRSAFLKLLGLGGLAAAFRKGADSHGEAITASPTPAADFPPGYWNQQHRDQQRLELEPGEYLLKLTEEEMSESGATYVVTRQLNGRLEKRRVPS